MSFTPHELQVAKLAKTETVTFRAFVALHYDLSSVPEALWAMLEHHCYHFGLLAARVEPPPEGPLIAFLDGLSAGRAAVDPVAAVFAAPVSVCPLCNEPGEPGAEISYDTTAEPHEALVSYRYKCGGCNRIGAYAETIQEAARLFSTPPPSPPYNIPEGLELPPCPECGGGIVWAFTGQGERPYTVRCDTGCRPKGPPAASLEEAVRLFNYE